MKRLENQFVKGSIILLLFFNTYNFLNFAFHFAMVRLLDIAAYGILATLFAVIYVITVFTDSIQMIIARYSTKNPSKDIQKDLLVRSLQKASRYSLVLFIGYALLAIVAAPALSIPSSLLVLNGIMIFLSLAIPVTRGILQGNKQFYALGSNMVVESSIRIVLAVVLVFAGWSVYGAIAAHIFGATLAFILSFIPLRPILASSQKHANVPDIYSYSYPAFFMVLYILIFYSMDVIIAKAVFDELTAGAYAVASILAKTIFFGTQPISRAMFPYSVEEKEHKQKKEGVMIRALGLLVLVAGSALLLFYFLAHFIVTLFVGSPLPNASNILLLVGISMSIIALTNLVLMHKLSKNTVSHYHLLLIGVIVQPIVLVLFSETLYQFTIALLFSSALLLWISVVFVGNVKKT